MWSQFWGHIIFLKPLDLREKICYNTITRRKCQSSLVTPFFCLYLPYFFSFHLYLEGLRDCQLGGLVRYIKSSQKCRKYLTFVMKYVIIYTEPPRYRCYAGEHNTGCLGDWFCVVCIFLWLLSAWRSLVWGLESVFLFVVHFI